MTVAVSTSSAVSRRIRLARWFRLQMGSVSERQMAELGRPRAAPSQGLTPPQPQPPSHLPQLSL